jgi:undecaprenyl-diphosphatase
VSNQHLPLRHALLLGLIHGPTELLPVSSSAHTALLPRLLGWDSAELPAELRNTFEVALHSGAALGLAYALRRDLRDALEQLDRTQLVLLACAIAPPALLGYRLEGRLDRRLGGRRAIALGLAGGALAMAAADRRRPATRHIADATPQDGLALGLAQALALFPGVSRNGATLTAARARGFTRADSQTLSWRVGLPVILGATLLKGRRLARAPLPAGLAAPFALGASASLLSTLACAPLLHPARRARSLLPFALYRAALAALALRANPARRCARARCPPPYAPHRKHANPSSLKKVLHSRF